MFTQSTVCFIGGSGYWLEFILRIGVLRMGQNVIITQASLSPREGPQYPWLDVLGRVTLAKLQA